MAFEIVAHYAIPKRNSRQRRYTILIGEKVRNIQLQDYQLRIVVQALKTHYHKYNKENDPELFQHLNEVEFIVSEIERMLREESLVGKTFIVNENESIKGVKDTTEVLMKGTAKPLANDPIDW